MVAVPADLPTRNRGLGASDAAAAVGLSKWKSPYELWLEKTGQAPSDVDPEALPIVMGNVLEAVVLAQFTKRTGLTVTRRQEQVVDPSWPIRWVTLDGMASDGGLVEAKSAGFADPAEWGDEHEDDAVPMQYYLQCQHGLACTDAPFAYMPLVVLNRQFRLYRIQRNDEVIQQLTEQERLFWACVEERIAPDPVSLEDAALRWPTDTAAEIVASSEVVSLVHQIKDLREQEKALRLSIDGVRLQIEKYMGEHGALTPAAGAKPLITWKQAKPTRVLDTDALRAAHPYLCSKYEIERPGSRRFLVK